MFACMPQLNSHKPTGRVRLDVYHPLYKDVTRAYLFRDIDGQGAFDDSIFKDHLTGPDVDRVFEQKGQVTYNVNSSAIYQSTPMSPHNGTITIFHVGRYISAGANYPICAGDSSTTGERDFQFRFNTSNQVQFIPFVGGTSYTATGTTAKNTTDVYSTAATYDGETAKVYLNGLLEGSNTSPSGNMDADNPRYCWCARALSTTDTSLTDVATIANYVGLIFKRALTDGEIMSLHMNPYQLWVSDDQMLTSINSVSSTISALGSLHLSRIMSQ